jgi:hypothetical protein
VLLALAAYGCSSTPPPRVPLVGEHGDAAALAGEWAGEYSSPVTGRSGSILFTLTADGDTARGDVVMTLRDPMPGSSPDPAAARSLSVPASRPLTIRFVRVEGGRVSGELAPYEDPDCSCTVRTVFTGTVRGDVIEGTFTSTGSREGYGYPTGEWRVTRRR